MIRNNTISTILFLLISLCGMSQTVTVIDKISRETLPGVLIYSKDQVLNTVTNTDGKADISMFMGRDSIFVSYVAYKTLALTAEILAEKKTIELSAGELTMQEVVVSANRWEEEASETPKNIVKISRNRIGMQNLQTSADILESTGQVFMQKSQQAGGSPMIRGFATNRLLLVVDGVRMNNAIFRSGNVQNVLSLDPHMVQSAEVLFGPGAVMYGSDAIGGVMDFHTLDPQFADGHKKIFAKSEVLVRHSSANKEKTVHADANVGGKKWSWLSSFSYSDYADLRAGKYGNSYYLRPRFATNTGGRDTIVQNEDPRLQVRSGFAMTGFNQKIGLKPDSTTQIDYGFYYSQTSNAPRYDRLYADADNNGVLDYGEWYYGPQTWMMNRLSFRHQRNNLLYTNARVIAAWQKYGESRNDRRFGSASLRRQIEQVQAYSLNVDLDKNVGRFSLFYGMEAVYNVVRSKAFRVNRTNGATVGTDTRYPDGSSWKAYGFYVNAKYKLQRNLFLSAGIRFSRFTIDAEFDTTAFALPFTTAHNSNGAFNGGAGLSWVIDNGTRLYTNVSSGFRAPNLDDIGKIFESQPGLLVVPNPELGPEYAYNFELGAVKIFSGRVKLKSVFFYTLLNNALARRPFTINGHDSVLYEGTMSSVYAIQNISNAYVYGVQGSLEVKLNEELTMSSDLSFQQGRELSADDGNYYPLPHVAPLFGRTEISYLRRGLKLNLYAVYNGRMDFKDLSLNDRNDDVPFAKDPQGKAFVPSWYTLNIKFSWYISRHFILGGGVENITDRLYRPFSSGISAPGRNFILSVRARL